MANKRIYYAVHQAGIKSDADVGDFTEIHGLQNVAINTNFNLAQVFQLGQLSIYENIENIPDVEITSSKVLDGYPLIFLLATLDAIAPTLAARSKPRCIFGLSIFSDDLESATGTPGSVVQCSGMFVNSVSYTFPLDDSFKEDVTLVGNDKVWKNDPRPTSTGLPDPSFDGAFDGNDAPIGIGGVNRRENMLFEYDSGEGLDVNGMVADSDATILPPEVWGISDSGTNEKTNGQDFDAHLSSITVSADFGRESINELGRKAPYYRSVTFPLEVTCQIEVTSTSGDMISATENGIYTTGSDACTDGGNLVNRTIRIATCEGTRLYLGIRNKLASVSYSGGDAGGGNVTVTYSFSTFNDLTVMHSGDPNTNFLWANRNTYLRDV
jgi:hypothetical protein